MQKEADYDPKFRYGIFAIVALVLIYFVFIQGQGSTLGVSVPRGTPLVLVATAAGDSNFEHIPMGQEIKVQTTDSNDGAVCDAELVATAPVKVQNGRFLVIPPGMKLTARFEVDKAGNMVILDIFVHTYGGLAPLQAALKSDGKPFVRILSFWETVANKF